MKIYMIFFSILLMSMLGCVSASENIIAINILLTPDEELYDYGIYLSELMSENNPRSLALDDNRIPHITLLQAYINEEDLPRISQALKGVYSTISSKDLMAESLVFSKGNETSFAMIRIEKSESLLKLHKQVIALVKPFIVKRGSEQSFVPNFDGRDIDQFTIDYVPEFIAKYSYENYDPHLSLGVADTAFLENLSEHEFKPRQFKSAALSIYQLGEYGTAQKLLWQSE